MLKATILFAVGLCANVARAERRVTFAPVARLQ